MSTSSSTAYRHDGRRSPADFGPKPAQGGPCAPPPPDPDDFLGPGSFAACGLDGRPRNAGQARRFVGVTLAGWALDALVPDMELVVSELVTNAVQHGLVQPPEDTGAYPLWLGLFRQSGQVVCTVTDPNPEPPCPHPLGASADGGRGLALVGALSDSWSWSLTPPQGKAVWASLGLPARAG